VKKQRKRKRAEGKPYFLLPAKVRAREKSPIGGIKKLSVQSVFCFGRNRGEGTEGR